jgi:type IV pilus assembly protein PilA
MIEKPHGFSLLELMIVIVIIGILSGIAIPSYRSYMAKAKFTEVIAATQPFKLAISLALQQGIAESQLNNGYTGIPPAPTPSAQLASISIQQGVITATATATLDHATYILSPKQHGTRWDISGSCLSLNYC